MLIATRDLYVNLREAPLVEAERVHVFSDRDVAVAYANLIQSSSQSWSAISRFVELSAGSCIAWDGKGWKIANIGETVIGLLGENQAFTEVPINAFERLVRESHITGVTAEPSLSIHPEAKKLFDLADEDAYAEANRRFEIVQAHINGLPLPVGENISARTLRRWKAQYIASQEMYGRGYVGLLPHKNNGNPQDKLPPTTLALMEKFINSEYETYKQMGKFEVYSLFRLACERQGVIPASYKTFTKAIKRHRSSYEQKLKRQGPKAAYKYEEFYLELEVTTPRHGDRPFHIVHMDHTELDVELVCSITGQKLGRPWATFLTDAYSRRILAVYLTYEKPSYRSCMMALRELVRRFGRFPQIIVVDGGREFSSVYFETLMAIFECTKKTRPPSKSRFGSICERIFGTTNTRFIHNLLYGSYTKKWISDQSKMMAVKKLVMNGVAACSVKKITRKRVGGIKTDGRSCLNDSVTTP